MKDLLDVLKKKKETQASNMSGGGVRLDFVLVLTLMAILVPVIDSQNPADPCKANPCGNGICYVDRQNR